MLRVGLTGELGSGKSTVARMLAAHGAIVLSSDDMARAMMQPGHPVHHAILDRFGPEILLPNGELDRPALARLAFHPTHPRVEELNAIIHPAVLAGQEQQLAALARSDPHAIAVIESALIFTTKHAPGTEPWRHRFDRIVLVTAPDTLKLQRFLTRVAAGRTLTEPERLNILHDAQARLAAQRIPKELAAGCFVLENNGDLPALQHAVDSLWTNLTTTAHP